MEQHFQHLNAGLALKRRIIDGHRPSSPGAAGLGAALDHLARDFSLSAGIPVTMGRQEVVVLESTHWAIYRVVQESLTNVGRYAHADKVKVSLLDGERDVIVIVADNGRGFDPGCHRPGRHGIAAVRQRVEACGGQLRVTSAPGKGTRDLRGDSAAGWHGMSCIGPLQSTRQAPSNGARPTDGASGYWPSPSTSSPSRANHQSFPATKH
ncbi:ATP-binding protein [Variovorax humicola]|uniref:histidine kinase n=1 Tax=Variovorax humicola TaxID=1769758 RepID=A0ABU8W9J9_9BURK